ncbi:MAG: 16S rRNA (guanine(966)-N(2))-methyltransferase RsmD [Candidatus Cloacimonetes bacterium]|nr:16S rRNA (guanine(966)-N(2))-methyltransferase RsmD [Candidatus Cloacimonadota bacterium]MBL7107839.1 16S rRNA (guanine(966)-N(2))-methyltransferase RsmD [Candidatus Cloacimonadota bacterium]
MQIISGKFKGYKLKKIPKTNIRPTMDRVKESIFAMIRDRLNDAVVLDLFAGTGSLGIEALSEGSENCHFVDKSYKSTKCIKENISILGIENAKVIKNSAQKFIPNCRQNFYDIIFIDPPYEKKIITKIIEMIYEFKILKPNGLIIAECGIDENLAELNGKIIKTKIYGETKISFLRKNDSQ